MATYYVLSSYGYDGADGLSVETGWATLEYAVTQVVAGDEVRLVVVEPGETFDLQGTLTFSASGDATDGSITWTGANSAGTVDGTVAILNLALGGVFALVLSGSFNYFQYIKTQYASLFNWQITGNYNSFCRCQLDGGTGSASVTSTGISWIECLSENSDGFATSSLSTGDHFAIGCIARNGTSGFVGSVGLRCIHCIAYNNSGAGYAFCSSVVNCISYNNTNGIQIYDLAHNHSSSIINNIIVSNSAWGVRLNNQFPNIVANNAFFNNTSGTIEFPNSGIVTGNINLSGDPFVDPANGDFTLNHNAGGLECRNAGLPSAFNTISATTPYIPLGAIRPKFRRVTIG